jgi:hypothetical protein
MLHAILSLNSTVVHSIHSLSFMTNDGARFRCEPAAHADSQPFGPPVFVSSALLKRSRTILQTPAAALRVFDGRPPGGDCKVLRWAKCRRRLQPDGRHSVAQRGGAYCKLLASGHWDGTCRFPAPASHSHACSWPSSSVPAVSTSRRGCNAPPGREPRGWAPQQHLAPHKARRSAAGADNLRVGPRQLQQLSGLLLGAALGRGGARAAGSAAGGAAAASAAREGAAGQQWRRVLRPAAPPATASPLAAAPGAAVHHCQLPSTAAEAALAA